MTKSKIEFFRSSHTGSTRVWLPASVLISDSCRDSDGDCTADTRGVTPRSIGVRPNGIATCEMIHSSNWSASGWGFCGSAFDPGGSTMMRCLFPMSPAIAFSASCSWRICAGVEMSGPGVMNCPGIEPSWK